MKLLTEEDFTALVLKYGNPLSSEPHRVLDLRNERLDSKIEKSCMHYNGNCYIIRDGRLYALVEHVCDYIKTKHTYESWLRGKRKK